MGKKQRNRLTQKMNNNIPNDVVEASEAAHGKENSPQMRKPIQNQGKHE
ncbi:hypothetical protein [Lottiidibacillus patelloidae]|nr:hypothetical protein [Lottiidibacillus patelloidae]